MSLFSFIAIAQNAGRELGHPYNYHKACQKAILSIGGEFSAYIPFDATLSEIPSGWIPWFHNTLKQPGRFFLECAKIFRKKSAQKRVFFMESFGRKEFGAFACASLLFAKKTDKILLVYRDDLIYRKLKDKKTIYFFSKFLQWKLKNRFIPLSDSHSIANFFEKRLKKKVTVIPIPHVSFLPLCVVKKNLIVCNWLGEPRKEKGLNIIQKLGHLKDPLREHFLLEVSEMIRVSKATLSLVYQKSFMSEEEYSATIMESDVILLPYDPKRYERRTSNIFVESIIAGKMPLVSSGTWSALELKKFNLQELVVDWENPLFFTHLYALFHDEKIREKLFTMRKHYQHAHSLESFAAKMQEVIA